MNFIIKSIFALLVLAFITANDHMAQGKILTDTRQRKLQDEETSRPSRKRSKGPKSSRTRKPTESSSDDPSSGSDSDPSTDTESEEN